MPVTVTPVFVESFDTAASAPYWGFDHTGGGSTATGRHNAGATGTFIKTIGSHNVGGTTSNTAIGAALKGSLGIARPGILMLGDAVNGNGNGFMVENYTIPFDGRICVRFHWTGDGVGHEEIILVPGAVFGTAEGWSWFEMVVQGTLAGGGLSATMIFDLFVNGANLLHFTRTTTATTTLVTPWDPPIAEFATPGGAGIDDVYIDYQRSTPIGDSTANTGNTTMTANDILVELTQGTAEVGLSVSETLKYTQGLIEVGFTSPVFTPLVLACTSVNTGVVGTPYSATLVASGGTPPYTFSIISGSLPPGLSLNASTGVISGTPTASGSYMYTAQVVDSAAMAATATIICSISIRLATGAVPCPAPNRPCS